MFLYSNAWPSVQIQENLKRISEKTIQSIWHYLFLKTDKLTTVDGYPVTILFQGHWNNDTGPDFQNAKIKIGDRVLSGEVEIHHKTSDWYQHRHDGNPRYNNVILHVVYHHDLPAVNQHPPVLELKHVLSESLDRLITKIESIERSRKNIFCYEEVPSLSRETIDEWIMENGMLRFNSRIQAFRELKLQYMMEWDELLYYGFMDALGFSKNREPFRRLARLIPLERLREVIQHDNDSTALMKTQALLFGASGLLDFEIHSIQDHSLIPYLQRLNQLWSDYQRLHILSPLKSTDWQLFRMRPVNYPTLRIAGFSQWITRQRGRSFVDTFLHIISGKSSGTLIRTLEQQMMIPAFGYWNRHYIWNDKGRTSSHELIGRQRAHEMIVNVILPVISLYAEQTKSADISEIISRLYRESASREINALTRYMTAQLYRQKASTQFSVQFAQGLIHLYKRCVVYDCCDCRLFEKTVEKAVDKYQDGLS